MSSGAMVTGVVCVTVYLFKTICMFGYVLGCGGRGRGGEASASAASYIGAGEWRWRPAALASPCKCLDCRFWNTQTNHFIPGALQTLTS